MYIKSGHFAQLVIYDRERYIKTVTMGQKKITIGRNITGSSCDVLISSELVSSMHGVIVYHNDEYYYVDNVNINGTSINGRKIPKKQGEPSLPCKLRDGDILTIGNSSISPEKTVHMLFSTSVSNDYDWNAIDIRSITDTLVIGRDPHVCNICISEVTVSKKHAFIKRMPNGTLTVTDNKSVNGTILNGNTINARTISVFKELDTICIGSVKIINFGDTIIYNSIKQKNKSGYIDIIENSMSNINDDNSIIEVKSQITESGSRPMDPYERERRLRNGGVELRIENLTKTVPCKPGTGPNGGNKKNILENVSLTIYPGELVAILGGSGAGKTTLMNAINGFEPATQGTVYINGNDLYRNYQTYKAQIGYVPQQDIVYDNLTMVHMLTYVAKLRLPEDLTKSEIERRVDDVLNAVDLQKQKFTLIKKLSGGQRKRASIAVELISDPSLFFLDEPTSGLDPEAETNLMKQLKNLSARESKTIIVITHTLQNIHLFDKVIFMAPGGKLCYYGSPNGAKAFFEVENLSDAYEKISANVDMYVNKYNQLKR